MGTDTLTALLAVFAVLSAVLAVLLIARIRREDRLTAAIELYLSEKKPLAYSMRDDRFARLHNAVCELCGAADNAIRLRERDNEKTAAFIADISHQLKTPLTGIRLFREMEQNEHPTANGERELKLLDKTERLIYDLIKLQKLKAKSFPMEFAPVKLSELLREAAEPFIPLFPEKNFRFTGDAELRCDRLRLSEALGNILKNACEHTKEDGTVTATVEEGDHAVNVVIEDDGGGVKEEELPLLFDRFFRSENAAPAGTGIGLSIAKEIIERHHGIVSAENGRKGLRISICLPVIEGTEKTQL